MKRLNSFFFIFYLLLITGGFAAIAQNAYGIDILAWSCVGFAVLCLLGALMSLLRTNKNIFTILEYFALSILFIVAALRVFLIYFTGVELIFSIAGVSISTIYIFHIIRAYKEQNHENLPLTRSLNLFYTSIVVYTLSMVLNPISLIISQVFGFLGFASFILALVMARRVKSIIVRKKEVSMAKYLSTRSNRATLLLSLFLLLTVYTGANSLGIVPDLHSSAIPDGYYKLVKDAESGIDPQIDGKYRYEIYKERMDKFMEKQGVNK